MATIDDAELAQLRIDAKIAQTIRAARKHGAWLFVTRPLQAVHLLVENLPVGAVGKADSEAIQSAINKALFPGVAPMVADGVADEGQLV